MTTQQISNGLIYGEEWSFNNLTYSFKTSQLSYEYDEDYEGSVAVSQAMQEATHQVFDMLESFLDLEFTYTEGVGDIVISSKEMSSDGLLGYAYIPGVVYHNQGGDVYINANFSNENFEVGSVGWGTLVHEFGHALGLDHPFGEGEYEGIDIHHTIMSYNDYTGKDINNHTYNTFSYIGYQPADILALQTIYGAKEKQSDNIYNLANILPSETIDSSFGLSKETLYTIYDFSGEDTLSLTDIKNSDGQYININDNTESIIVNGELDIYLSIALDSTIENIIGSRGDDIFILNEANNYIDGGNGEDNVKIENNGENRIDILDNKIIISNKESGFDIVENIESLTINNQEINLSENQKSFYHYEEDVAAEISRLYLSVFNRLADKEGLDYWIADYDNGQNINQIAHSFILSEEFISLYEGSTSDAEYINLLYNNVLYRDADQEGVLYWENDMQNNNNTKADVLVSFSNSIEFIDLTGVYFEGNDIFVG